MPRKTIVLTFDDGPHRRYTEEVSAMLKQYGAPAVFFNAERTALLRHFAVLVHQLVDAGGMGLPACMYPLLKSAGRKKLESRRVTYSV